MPDTLAVFCVSSITLACLAVRLFSQRRAWASNIRGPPSTSKITGNLMQLIDPVSGWDYQVKVQHEYGGIVKIQGLLERPTLFVSDPRALHHILVKEPYVFEEWAAFTSTNALLFGDGLVATVGAQHKKQRKMLNPVFSAKHLRGMMPTFFQVGERLTDALKSGLSNGSQEIDMTGWFNRTALELIGQSGLGYSFGDFKTEENEFAAAVKDLAAAVSVMVPAAPFTPYFSKLGPSSFRRFILKCIPWPLLQKLRTIVDIMEKNVQEILQTKQQDLKESKLDQKDIISILLKANSISNQSERMSEDELLGQMATLLFTATDTTSGAMARLCHLLALNPSIQDRLRAELVQAFGNSDGDLDFDQLSNLPYLDAVIKETLRVFPPIPMVFRQTTNESIIPLLHPIQGADGTVINEVWVPKGAQIFISILGSNHFTPTWGEDVDEWNPERWLTPLPETVMANRSIAGAYSHMMTFLSGGRACIGFQFSQLEMKVVLSCLLRSFRFYPPKDKEIGWNMGLLMTPVVRGDDALHSQMPLIVETLEHI